MSKRSFEDIRESVSWAVGKVKPPQVLNDLFALVAYVNDARRERDEARALLGGIAESLSFCPICDADYARLDRDGLPRHFPGCAIAAITKE